MSRYVSHDSPDQPDRERSFGDSVNAGAIGGIGGRGNSGTTDDGTWIQQQEREIYGYGGVVYSGGGEGGYNVPALPNSTSSRVL